MGSAADVSLTNTFLFLNNDTFDVYNESFRLPSANIHLGSGTYYLTLLNGTSTNDGAVAWDFSNGPSIAYQTVLSLPGTTVQLSRSQSFQVFSVPEPSTWTLLRIGFAGLGFAGYGKAKGPALPAA